MGYRLFVRLWDGAAGAAYAACLAGFLRPFMEGEKRWKALAVVFAAYALPWLGCGDLFPQALLTPLTVALLLAAAKIVLIERPMLLLLLLLYFCTRLSAGLAVESLYFVIDSLFPLDASRPETAYLHSGMAVSMLLGTHLAVLTALLYLLKRRLMKKRLAPDWREICYLGLIPVASILFGKMVASMLFEVQQGVLLTLYERHPAFLLLVPLLAGLFYLGMFFTIALHQGMMQLREEREAGFVQRQQAQAIRERMAQWEQLSAGTRQLEHDLRGHLMNLKGLAQGGHYEEIEPYIARMDAQLGSYTPDIRTGNAVTDVVLSDKRQQAERLGIDFQADFYYPAAGRYDAFDLGVILHNLLQNALEACEGLEAGRRYIRLIGKSSGRFFLIEVRNPFSGELVFGGDGLPLTAKRQEAGLHGLGLPGIRRTAEQYGGGLELKAQDGEFCVTVLLQGQG